MKFSDRVYEKLKQVPKGKVITYKALARVLNSKAYRAVGSAMKKNPYGYAISPEAIRNRRSGSRRDLKRTSGLFLVPCHRVINSNGRVGGFASGTKNKIKLLSKEGIKIEKGKIDLKKYLYKFK